MLESTAAEARQRYAEAVAVVKRGLGEHAALDVAVEEVDCLALLLLARHSHAADGLQMLYGVVDLLEDADCLRLPSEASLDEREPDLQRLLVQLSASHAVKAEAAALKKCAVALEKSARQRGARGREPITPLLLWRRHYAEATPPPSRKLKPPPPPPENAWQLLIPDRAPSSVSKAELSKLFKKWMLRNHPDKGGDQDLAARVSAHYSHALGRDQTTDEERNEDVVFSQQQQQAEADWASYKRQCSEQEANSTEPNLDARALPLAWSASQAYLDQRLLKALRWVTCRRTKQTSFLLEVDQAESSASKSEPPPLPESVKVECTPRKLTSLRRTSSSPGITRNSPVLAFGSRAPSPLRDKASQERERAAIVFENCTAEGEGLHLAFPNTSGHFIIQARDKLYLPVACDIDAFSVQIRGKQHVSPAVSAPGDGSSIRVQYEIAVCGSYKVHVRGGKKGVHVIGSPFTLIVKPAPASAEHCTAEGAALYRSIAGEQASFTLQRKDNSGRLIPRGSARFIVQFKNAIGQIDSTISPKVVDRGDGTFNVSYSTHRAGDLFVHVLLALSSPTPISGSPFALKVAPASLAAAECELIAPAAGGGLSVDGIRVQPGEGLGASLRVGRPFALRLIGRDKHGNQVKQLMPTQGPDACAEVNASGGGADCFKVSMVGCTGRQLPGRCILTDDGDLEVHGVVFDAEAYTLHVCLGGVPVKGSPLPLQFEECDLDLASCAITFDSALVGDTRIALGIRDVFGNITTPNEACHGRLCGAILPCGSWGKLSVSDKVSQSATAELEEVNDPWLTAKEAVDSIFPEAVPIEWTNYLSRLRSRIMHATQFGADGSLKGKVSPDRRNFAPSLRKESSCESIENSRRLKCVWHSSDEALAEVLQRAGASRLEELSLETCSKSLRILHTSSVTAAGAYQLVIWEDDEPNEARSQMALRDGSGKMDVGPRFNANGARLPGSSSSTVVLTMGIAVVPGLLSMRHSQVQLPQNLREPPCAGQTFSIGLKGFDRHANPLNTSGGVRLMLTQVTTPPPSAFNSDAPPVHLQHIDHRNGMHELRITAYRAGDYQLMLSAVPLSIHGRDDETHQTASAVLKSTEGGRILKLRVMPGELDASKCVLRTVGGAAARTTAPANANPASMQPQLHAPSDVRVGAWNSMLLQCADSYGNVRSAMQAQASELHLELHECTPEGTKHDPLDATRWLRSEQRLNEDGSIWLRYAPLAAGALSLSIKLNGQHVLGSPILLKVNVGAIAYASCELLGEGISFCRRGLPAKFKIAARDAFGNARSRGGDGFSVTLLSCDGGVAFGESNEAKIDIVAGTVIDHNDGTYDVEYMCSSIGKHMLSVCSASGQHLQGSPFKVQCIGAAPHLQMCSLVRSERGGDILYCEESEVVSLGGKRSDSQPARLGQLTACGPPMRVFFRLRDASGESTRPLESSPIAVALLKREEASEWSRADVLASPTLFDLSESPHSPDDSSTATPADEMLYVCTLEVRVAGTFALALASTSTPAVVGPTLAQFEVVPGRAHLTGCQIVGLQSPSTQGLVSVPFEFTIVTHDAASNRLKQGGEAISITLEGPVTTQAPRVTVHDADDGSYAVRFVPHAPGTYAVTLFMGHEQVSSPAMVTISRTGQATSLRQKVPALSMTGLTPSSSICSSRASTKRDAFTTSARRYARGSSTAREHGSEPNISVGCGRDEASHCSTRNDARLSSAGRLPRAAERQASGAMSCRGEKPSGAASDGDPTMKRALSPRPAERVSPCIKPPRALSPRLSRNASPRGNPNVSAANAGRALTPRAGSPSSSTSRPASPRCGLRDASHSQTPRPQIRSVVPPLQPRACNSYNKASIPKLDVPSPARLSEPGFTTSHQRLPQSARGPRRRDACGSSGTPRPNSDSVSATPRKTRASPGGSRARDDATHKKAKALDI